MQLEGNFFHICFQKGNRIACGKPWKITTSDLYGPLMKTLRNDVCLLEEAPYWVSLKWVAVVFPHRLLCFSPT